VSTTPEQAPPAADDPAVAADGTEPQEEGYAKGARVLSIGIASTGLFTFAYFSVSSHVLGDGSAYGAISTLWAILFVVICVIYRPVEQLLSRTIAHRRARGLHTGHPLRTPLMIQGGFALVFLIAALGAHSALLSVLNDSETLYWIFVGSALAYGASYFARGYFAGHQWFALYGGLVLFESVSRFCFPVAVAIGLLHGPDWVAAGILAAPIASLIVVPFALKRMHGQDDGAVDPEALTLAEGAGFALSVAAIQLAEQSLLNAGVLTANITASAAVAGVVFSALMIARAPLQLFQAVQTSLLPHLTGLHTNDDDEGGFDKTIGLTVKIIAGFAGIVALALLAIGPWAMKLLFGGDTTYGRVGLAVLGIGMGFHLMGGTYNQAALARHRDRAAAAIWLVCAVLFVGWMLTPFVDNELTRAEVGYAGATLLLVIGLRTLYHAGGAPSPDELPPVDGPTVLAAPPTD
jgi:O-antigen/teichoic acid export membrane protein